MEIATLEWLLYLTALSSWFRLVINIVPFISDKPREAGLTVEEVNPEVPIRISFLRLVFLETFLDSGVL